MNAVSRSFIRYAALRSCLRGVAIFTLLAPLAPRSAWAQPVPGDDESVLSEAEAQPTEAPLATDEPQPEEAPLEPPRKAKRRPPAPKRPLRSLARQGVEDADAPVPPGAVYVHLETPVPAALYDIGTGTVKPGTEPPHAQLVCHSPCDDQVDVSGGQLFAVWAAGMEMSDPFTMRKDTRRAVVELDPASSVVNDTGLVLFGIGGGAFAGASSVLLYAYEQDELSNDLLAGCGVTMGLGTLLMLIGTPLVLERRYPDVTVHEKPAGEAFAIDKRPEARAARPWLGEF